jgi:hypothetical protein
MYRNANVPMVVTKPRGADMEPMPILTNGLGKTNGLVEIVKNSVELAHKDISQDPLRSRFREVCKQNLQYKHMRSVYERGKRQTFDTHTHSSFHTEPHVQAHATEQITPSIPPTPQ